MHHLQNIHDAHLLAVRDRWAQHGLQEGLRPELCGLVSMYIYEHV
jgi:hypothetical protein